MIEPEGALELMRVPEANNVPAAALNQGVSVVMLALSAFLVAVLPTVGIYEVAKAPASN
jgi:hypothetical protein